MKILNTYIDSDKLSEDLKAAGITDLNKDRRLSDFAKEKTVEFLSHDSSNHVAFCNEVRKERTSNYKDYRIISRDIFNNAIGSIVFSVIMAGVAALLSYLLYHNVVDSYFRTIYIVFVIVIAATSELIYWSNYKDRRLRNVLVMSIWQASLVIIATIGLYTLLQFVFITIGF